MGVTISHRGGPVPESVVDEILSQVEEAFKREGWKDVTGIPPDHSKAESGVYWKSDETIPPGRVGYYRPASQEIADREHFIREYEREAEYGSNEAIPELGITKREYSRRHAEFGKKHLANLIRRGVLIPDDFKPGRQKVICVNADAHSETFCVEFAKDDGKDEWRDIGDFTKTQFVRSGPGVHVGFCDFLEDVQKKVQKAGADYEINDEGEYCDDEEGHKHDPREIVKAVNETAQVMNKVMGQLQDQGWGVKESTPQQPSGGYSTGTLDDWISGAKSADLLITAPSRRGLRLLNAPTIQRRVEQLR